jgi:cytochrome c-type biogenesis protein CcmH/NrfG
VHSLDFRRVGIASWKVKVKIGLVYDFSDYRTLRKYIQDGRVTPGDSISYDAAETWVPIASIPDLEQYFIDTYVKRQADTKPNGREAGEDDGPTVIVGAGTLASSISAHLAAPPAAAPPGASVSGTSAAAAFAASVSSGSAPSNGVGYGGDVAVSSQSRSGMAIPGLSATAPMAADDPTSETSGPFSDPFEALKSKQRSRIKRNRTASRVKKTARGGNEGSGSSIDVKAVVAGLVLIVATGVVAWEVWEFWLRPAVPITEAEWAAMQAPRDPALLPAGSEARATFPEGASPDAWEKKLKEIYTTDRRTPISGANPEDEVRAVQPRNLPPPVPTNVGAGNTVPRASSAADYALAGKAAMDRGDYPIAIQSFNQAIKLEPQNAGHYAQLGIAQARAGNTVEANTTLARAAKLGSTVAEREMGNIARDRGDVAGALQHYTVYLRTDPPDQEAVQAEIDKLQGK